MPELHEGTKNKYCHSRPAAVYPRESEGGAKRQQEPEFVIPAEAGNQILKRPGFRGKHGMTFLF
jgi:hypothetical protein